MNRESEHKRLVELTENFFEKEIGASFVKGFLDKFADKILDDGWMRPPVKVGDMVFALWETPTLYTEAKYVIYSAEVVEIRTSRRNCRQTTTFILEPLSFRGRRKEYGTYDFGKLIFTNKEEAEKALERR